jgi:hypothetical protein
VARGALREVLPSPIWVEPDVSGGSCGRRSVMESAQLCLNGKIYSEHFQSLEKSASVVAGA